MSTSARLLSLLSLLQTPRSWPGSELAERLEVSRRTVRRDVDRLRDLGYPVEGALGPDGGYRLGAGTQMPPLLLDDDEAIAIVVGLRTAAGHTVAGVDEAAARALAKLEQVLPPRLRRRFEELSGATTRLDWTGPTVDPDVLTVLARATSAFERLRFTYRGASGSEDRRSVEPHGLVVIGRRWYLVAWDEDRGDWRSFRVDRVADPWTTGRPFSRRELPGGVDAAAFVRQMQLDRAPTYRLVATVLGPHGEVAARASDALSSIERLADDRCRITIEGDTVGWLAVRLLLLDYDFVVHEPSELKAYLTRASRRFESGSREAPTEADDP